MTADLHTLGGAYALDALTPDEHELFKQHLATCASCRAELVELQATAARLTDVTWSAPPASLKRRLMDAVSRSSQERPVNVRLARGPWQRRAPMLLAAAAVLVVIASLGTSLVERNRISDLETQQSALAEVLTADDKTMLVRRLDDGGSVTMFVSASLDQAVMAMDELPPLDDKHSYQIWRIQRGGPVSEVVISRDQSTGAVTRLVDDVGDTEALAITVEPAGGSPQPTTEPIVTIAIT